MRKLKPQIIGMKLRYETATQLAMIIICDLKLVPDKLLRLFVNSYQRLPKNVTIQVSSICLKSNLGLIQSMFSLVKFKRIIHS